MPRGDRPTNIKTAWKDIDVLQEKLEAELTALRDENEQRLKVFGALTDAMQSVINQVGTARRDYAPDPMFTVQISKRSLERWSEIYKEAREALTTTTTETESNV